MNQGLSFIFAQCQPSVLEARILSLLRLMRCQEISLPEPERHIAHAKVASRFVERVNVALFLENDPSHGP
jgi:hypothetical protein